MNKRLFVNGLVGILVIIAISIWGCTPKRQTTEIKEPEPVATEEATKVELISVVGEGDAVLVETNGPVKYTAFKLTDPPRLIIDMPGVDVSSVKSPIDVNNNYITEIRTSTYGDEDKKIGRIEIGLKGGITHKVKSGENSILVDLKRDTYVSGVAGDEQATAPEEEAPQTADEVNAIIEKAREDVTVETKVVAGKEETTRKEAKNLTDVKVDRKDGEVIVTLKGDGEFGNFNAFGLDEPTRVVLDIWGVGATFEEREIPVGSDVVEQMRVGVHPDKVRIVFDSPQPVVPTYSVDKEDATLVVRFKKAEPVGAQVAEKTDTKPAAEPSAVASKEPVAKAIELKDIRLKKLPGRARLIIEGTGKPKFRIREARLGKNLIIDLPSTYIPENLRVTFDATELNTPVISISSYQASTKPEIGRIFIKLTGRTPYKVGEGDSFIYIDFPVLLAEKKPAAIKKPAKKVAAVRKPFKKADESYKTRRVNINMVDAQVVDVLRLLAEISDLNIVVSEDVKGTITLKLKNVPWQQAFDLVLRTKGLDSIKEGNIIRVAPREKIRQEKEEELRTKVAQKKLEELTTEFIRVNYDNASNIAPQVQNLLSDRGSVTVHETTNTLIVRDIKSIIKEVKDYVKKVDIPIPQVLIETRIVEAESSFARDLGIQWGVDIRESNANFHYNLFGSTTELGSAAPYPSQQSASYAGGGVISQDKSAGFTADVGVTNYAVNLPAAGTAGTLGALGFIVGKHKGTPLILDLRISAGEKKGLVKTISRPRIVTLNNKEAKIEQGESIPFETTSAAGTQTQFIDASLSLTVKPQVTPDGSILMDIRASRNAIGTYRTATGKPSISKKEASTTVLVKDGETTVIGGIIVSDMSRAEQGIPFLKDLPVVGWLFKGKSVTDSQKELLIFITPTILKKGEIK